MRAQRRASAGCHETHLALEQLCLSLVLLQCFLGPQDELLELRRDFGAQVVPRGANLALCNEVEVSLGGENPGKARKVSRGLRQRVVGCLELMDRAVY